MPIDVSQVLENYDYNDNLKTILDLLCEIKEEVAKMNSFLDKYLHSKIFDIEYYFILKNNILRKISKCYKSCDNNTNNLVEIKVQNYVANYTNSISQVIDKFDIIGK